MARICILNRAPRYRATSDMPVAMEESLNNTFELKLESKQIPAQKLGHSLIHLLPFHTHSIPIFNSASAQNSVSNLARLELIIWFYAAVELASYYIR